MDDKLTIFMAVIAVAVVVQMVFLAALYFMMGRLNERLESVTCLITYLEVMWEMVRARLLPALEETTRVLVLDTLVTLTSTILILPPDQMRPLTRMTGDYAVLKRWEC